MEFEKVIICPLFAIILLLSISTSVQAEELTEVNVNEILEKNREWRGVPRECRDNRRA